MIVATERVFSVRLGDPATHGGQLVTEASFEAAGVAFCGEWAPHPEIGAEVAVIVRDEETGQERCFRIDLAAGGAAPCEAP
jgi:hypothetical protein